MRSLSGVAITVVLSAIAAPGMAVPLELGAFVHVCTDGGAGGYEAFPDVCRLADGRLMCAFYAGHGHVSLPDERLPRGGRICQVTSADEGRTWSAPRVLHDGPHDDRDPSLVQLGDGRLLCTFFSLAAGSEGRPYDGLGTWLVESRDGGATWSEPRQIAAAWYASAAIRPLADGRLVLGVYREEAGTAQGGVLVSDDQAASWREVPIDNAGLFLDAETDVVELADGTLYAAQRPTMAFATSDDRGDTWTASRQLSFPGHCPCFLRTTDGAIILAHRIPHTSLRVSRDECRSWSDHVVIDEVAGAYPSLVNLADGSILVVYYEEGEGSNIRGRRFRVGPAGVVWLPLGIPPRPPDHAGWRAGTSRAVITPDTPVWLAGYGTKRAPDGVLHELWMKALALEDAAGHRAVLVTSDFQGVPRSMSDRVFAAVAERHGLRRDQLVITFSHNHCGPRLGDDLLDYYPVDAEQERLVADYTDRMVEAMTTLVGDALDRLVPAELATGRGRCGFAVNRRNNPEAEVPDRIAAGTLVGPVDHDVPVLRVERTDGSPLAILFGYACHPTTLNFTTWCGDYPGFAQLEVERHNPGATALFVNTCGGDQNPLPRRSVDLCRRYGLELAAGVQAALGGPLAAVTPELRTAADAIELPYEAVVTRQELEPLTRDGNAVKARWATRMLGRLAAGEQFPATAPYPLHAWRLGTDTLVIGMGAETVVDYALAFKRCYGPSTWVCGYCDDMIAYIPSRRVWEEGGYEGGPNLYEYGRPAFRWAGDVEERITAAVDRLVDQVRPH